MDDLITWLRAQLDDDERIARAAAGSMLWHGPVKAGEVWDSDKGFVYAEGQVPGLWDECLWKADTPGRYTREMSEQVAHHVARHDPARVLREVEAKRKITDWCVEVIGDRDLSRYGESGALRDDLDPLTITLAVETLRSLATVYSDCPGYLEEWRPE